MIDGFCSFPVGGPRLFLPNKVVRRGLGGWMGWDDRTRFAEMIGGLAGSLGGACTDICVCTNVSFQVGEEEGRRRECGSGIRVSMGLYSS